MLWLFWQKIINKKQKHNIRIAARGRALHDEVAFEKKKVGSVQGTA